MMAGTRPLIGLPDPVREPAFYRGVTVKRGLAWLVDAAITFLLCLLALPFTAFTALFWWPLLWMMVGFLYRWATLSSGSATWGMRLMAITIRDRHGAPLDPLQAFLHTFGYTVSVLVFPLQLLSVALMVALGRGQGLTDLLLGTAAINRPA
ncbi:putative membrane protein/domain protein [Rubellimicrobium thermophilum DSM 16684]|uniref:Putative membrane protein/domain protein n=1 Tax=Rubellimicrobium thermophilum DSM 16684 TaxID=1123069 RepID=S9R1V4_9RHOB|nr:RDD family protein [Rubellimicrobium thermophilum]EPX85933.1 putative membrane protein/domain protein [Rubellimicrobium thermophilum DSM 16684]